MTLDQIKAARPTLDFDPRYGSTSGPWTTAMFVDAVYRSLDRAGREASRCAAVLGRRCSWRRAGRHAAARPRRSSTSPAATTPSFTRTSPSAFRDRRSATISACRSTTAPARSPKPGTRRGSRCPSTSAARTPRPTSCADRSTCGSGTSATAETEQIVAIHVDISNFQQRRTSGWTAGRIPRAMPSTPGWGFRPGRGTATRWS